LINIYEKSRLSRKLIKLEKPTFFIFDKHFAKHCIFRHKPIVTWLLRFLNSGENFVNRETFFTAFFYRHYEQASNPEFFFIEDLSLYFIFSIMSKTLRSILGQIGEDLACKYLSRKGYRVLERNYRKPWGEIDIIAKAPDRTLVFVEVKTMRQAGLEALTPEDQVSTAKLKKFKRVCSLFAGKNFKLIDDKKGWRMDVLAIELSDEGEMRAVRHYENAG